MNLALEQQRVDDDSGIVDADVAHDLDVAGVGIDLDLADMAAVGKVGARRRKRADRFEADAELGRPAHRRVGLAREFDQPDRLVGADHCELAVGELDVAGRRFQHMAGHSLRLLDQHVGGIPQRRAADGHAARAVGAASEADRVGVALDHAHGVEIDAEPFRHHLGVDGLVALAVAVGAGDHGDAAVLVEADFHAVVERPADFHEIGDAAAAQLAALLRFRLARRRSPPSRRRLDRHVHHRLVVGAVVHQHERRLVGHRGRPDVIPAADFDRIDVHFGGGLVDQPLHHIDRLWLAGAAIGPDRRGVGVDRAQRDMRGRDVVDIGQRHRAHAGRHAGARRQIGALAIVGRDAQPDELAVLVERERGFADAVAAVAVALDAFRTLRHPFHRAAGLARGPGHQRVLRETPRPSCRSRRRHRAR